MTTLDRWSQVSPAPLALTGKEVHVIYASLERSASQVQQLVEVLSADERLQAHCFHLEQDRERFIVRRGLLRIILGRYLGTTPDRGVFQLLDSQGSVHKS